MTADVPLFAITSAVLVVGALVASGGASRVTLTGLRFGDELTARFRPDAEAAGVLLEPIFWPDDAGCDLIVRRIDE